MIKHSGMIQLFSGKLPEVKEAVLIRKQIIFRGTVQGVGFRWRAREAARLYECTGWCRNEWDGSVRMEIQGTEERIDQVIQAIEAGRYVWIREMEAKTIPADLTERGFRTE